ncbi:NDP-hexose 2,3-dehydratase family protein [Streptomyces avermitilis]|uniref:NDP-hexose 2,3-dehydratase family protein n=1 Tax=Streptomyces avermitilis TaxID=33903 RepID=UPI00369A6D69
MTDRHPTRSPSGSRPSPHPEPSASLHPRYDDGLGDRLALSATARRGVHTRTDGIPTQLAERARHGGFGVDRIPLESLAGWSFAPHTGNLAHHSGRFFSVEGMRADVEDDALHSWQQPIIRQPEVGILGLLAKELDGVLHFLMQAKMEPGNPGLVQLSPTVQATRSNYTKVHRGAGVPYIEYFTGPQAAHRRVIADVLQSEQGSWFFHKSNRNIVVETHAEVPLHGGFLWLTLGQLNELLHHDNVINMDSRSVLACLPFDDGDTVALHADTALLSWITEQRSRHRVHSELMPLASISGWTRDKWSITHREDRYFQVVGVSVQAGNREVPQWSQPLLAPVGTGVAAFLIRRFDGVVHVLARAGAEGGLLGTVELGPTVQCTPGNYAHLPPEQQPLFLDTVLSAATADIRYEAVLSEEGGRFLHACSRYLIIEGDTETAPAIPPEGFAWVSAGQLTFLARHSHYLNVQARSLLACIRASALAKNARSA